MKKLEDDYQRDYLKNSIKHIRISLILAFFLFAIFGVLDAILIPDKKHLIWIIRFGFVCPAILLVFFILRFRLDPKRVQQILTFLIIIGGSGIIMMILIAPPPISYSYYAGLILIFLFGYTFLRIQFVWASFGAWIVVLLYEIAAISLQTPLPIFINNNFFFLAANIIGMLACYSIELYSRHAFYLNRQLIEEKEKVRCINIDLENRIIERTNALYQANHQLENEVKVRKIAQENLSKSLKDWQITFDATNSVIWLLSIDGVILRTNKITEKFFKYSSDDVIGKNYSDILHGIQEPNSRCPVLQSKKSLKRDSTEYELNKSWYEVTADPILNTDGEYIGTVLIINNITEQKASEAQLRQARKLEAIGTLAGGIAHDFNNILVPLVGYAEMLEEDISSGNPLQEYVKEILRSSFRARDLVKQILTFSRKNDQNLKPIKLQPVIKEALKLLRSSIPTTIDIQLEIDPNCGLVIAESTQIHQVVMNLATNAYHAMENTGGLLKVSLKQIGLEVGQMQVPDVIPGKYARLIVSDTGHGIKEDALDKIFDPYFTTKETGKGTGLGLSVVQGIVKNCNGYIHIDSSPGKETSFKIYFPIIERRVENIEFVRKESIIGGTERILLVDDEEAIVKMEKQMLERLGYTVTTHTASVDAFESFKASPDSFDLLITDMTMPKVTGSQLAMQIRKIRIDLPVIICTGFSDQIDEEKSKALGIQGFIVKPMAKREIAGVIRKVIDNSNKS